MIFEVNDWQGAQITAPCATRFAQIPPADLDIPILGQLAPTDLAFGDALEAGF